MSSFVLRCLALLAMVLDHAGLALFPDIGTFRCVGRLSFPLYCFLLTQGYLHTKSRFAYGRRLLILALVSEIPFDLLIFARPVCDAEQNALFSLLLGLMALYAAETLKDRPVQAWLAVMAVCVCAMAASVSYGWLGPALCMAVWFGRNNRFRMLLFTAGALLVYSLSLALSGVAKSWVLVSLCAPLALIPMLLYSKKPGPRSRVLSFLFYAAYPLHLTALVIIRALRIIPPYFLSQ